MVILFDQFSKKYVRDVFSVYSEATRTPGKVIAHAFCETAANAMMIPNDRRMNDIIEQLEANGQLAIQVMDAK